MAKWALCGGLAILAGMVAGCGKADIEIPSSWGGATPPPSHVTPADPNSPPDLRRENDQLRQRIAWLEDQIRRSDKKSRDLDGDVAELRAENNKIAAERDRYKAAGGGR